MNSSDDELEWEAEQEFGYRRGMRRIGAALLVFAIVVPLVLGALDAIF